MLDNKNKNYVTDPHCTRNMENSDNTFFINIYI